MDNLEALESHTVSIASTIEAIRYRVKHEFENFNPENGQTKTRLLDKITGCCEVIEEQNEKIKSIAGILRDL